MSQPVEYIPERLRPQRKILRKRMFGIGIPNGDAGFGMVNGPTEILKEMLDNVPSDIKSVIIRFNEDGSDDVIFKWELNRWIRTDPDMERLNNFHWDPSKLCGQPELTTPTIPVTLNDAGKKEQWQERVMRMLYQMSNVVRSCSMCSLGRQLCNEFNTVFDPHVFSTMNPARWMVVGQNPGFNECLQGKPFVGEAGKFFDDCIGRNGLSRSDFYVTNCVKCHSLGNERPSAEYMSRCEPILMMEVNLLRPILVITLGSVAFNVFFPQLTMSDHLGKILKSDKFGVDVYPVYHPSPRNTNDPEKRQKFNENISDLCALIKAYREKASGQQLI
jgi:DNA polymerase